MWPSVPIDGPVVGDRGQQSSSTLFAEHASAWKGHCRYGYRGRGRSVRVTGTPSVSIAVDGS